MPTEQEELVLRVSLDDQASAQIAALRGQLDQMRGAGGATAATAGVQQAAPQIVEAIGEAVKQLTAMSQQLQQLPTQITTAMSATVQGLQQVQGQLTQIGTQTQQAAQQVAAIPGHLRQGTQALTGAIRGAGFIGGFAGAAAEELMSQLSRLGNNLIQRSTDFHGLSEEMKNLEANARGVGRSMTGYQGLERQLQLGGMNAEQAKKTISQLSDLELELQRYGAQNAPTTHRILQDVADPETFQYLSKFMQQMEGAPIEQKVNLISEALENMRQTMTARGEGGGFEAARSQFLERLGISPDAFNKMREGIRLAAELYSPAREAMLRARTEETEKFERASLTASFYWKDIGESIAASVLHGLGLNDAMDQLNTWLKGVLKDLETFERVFRETGSLEKAVGALSPAWAPFAKDLDQAWQDLQKAGDEINKWNQYFADAGKSSHDNFVEPLQKALTDMWDAIPEGLKDFLTGKRMLEKPPQMTGREPTFGEKLNPLSPYNRYEEMKRQGFSEEQIREYMEKHQGAWHLPGELPKPEGPATAIAPLPKLVTPEEQKRIEDRLNVGRPPAPPAGFEERFCVWPGGAPAVPEGGKPTITPATMRSLIEGAQGEGGGPIIVPASMMQAQPAVMRGGAPAPQAISTDQQATLIGEQTQAMRELSDALKAGTVQTGQTAPDVALPEINVQQPPPPPPRQVELPPLVRVPSGVPGVEAPVVPSAQLTAEQREQLLRNAPPQSDQGLVRSDLGIGPSRDPEGFAPQQEGSKDPWTSFEKRFGIWPGMGAEKLDRSSAKLDEAAASNVNISGAGRIKVDVNAPPGTTVSAESEGFFKATEVTRLTSMFPADFGPLPVTGIGAGQGTSGNSTATA